MPYIDVNSRIDFVNALNTLQALVTRRGLTKGELNYLMTKLAHMYQARHGTSYAVLNDVIGVFEAAKLEFYRRKVVPYEDTKIEQNGDV